MNAILLTEFDDIYKRLESVLHKLNNKAILITGATGLIGCYLVKFLLYLNERHNMGINIYATSTSLQKLYDRFGSENANLHYLQMDLSVSVKFHRKFNFVIHAAGVTSPDVFANNPVGVMRTNLIGTMSVLDSAIMAHGGRFLFISSGEIYGNNITDVPFVETDNGNINCTVVRSGYPESKRACETLCMSYEQQYGIHVNVARLCYIYGPTITQNSMRVDAQCLRAALNGENIVLNTMGNQRRTWCYVADATAGILQILLCAKSGAVYNVAHTKSIATIFEYATTLANIAGVRVCISANIYGGGNSILDGTKLIELGWQPQYDLQTGLLHTFNIKKSQ